MNELDIILNQAEKEHDKLKHPYVGTEHLLLSLLSFDTDLTRKLKENKLTYLKFNKKLKEIIGKGSNKSPYLLYTPMLRKVIAKIDVDNSKDINTKLYNSLIEANDGVAISILKIMNVKLNKI